MSDNILLRRDVTWNITAEEIGKAIANANSEVQRDILLWWCQGVADWPVTASPWCFQCREIVDGHDDESGMDDAQRTFVANMLQDLVDHLVEER